jgi:hypothetical protein
MFYFDLIANAEYYPTAGIESRIEGGRRYSWFKALLNLMCLIPNAGDCQLRQWPAWRIVYGDSGPAFATASGLRLGTQVNMLASICGAC